MEEYLKLVSDWGAAPAGMVSGTLNALAAQHPVIFLTLLIGSGVSMLMKVWDMYLNLRHGPALRQKSLEEGRKAKHEADLKAHDKVAAINAARDVYEDRILYHCKELAGIKEFLSAGGTVDEVATFRTHFLVDSSTDLIKAHRAYVAALDTMGTDEEKHAYATVGCLREIAVIGQLVYFLNAGLAKGGINAKGEPAYRSSRETHAFLVEFQRRVLTPKEDFYVFALEWELDNLAQGCPETPRHYSMPTTAPAVRGVINDAALTFNRQASSIEHGI